MKNSLRKLFLFFAVCNTVVKTVRKKNSLLKKGEKEEIKLQS